MAGQIGGGGGVVCEQLRAAALGRTRKKTTHTGEECTGVSLEGGPVSPTAWDVVVVVGDPSRVGGSLKCTHLRQQLQPE